MLYRTQKDFEKFKCIADKCPKSCCVGWQIVIDDDSLHKYQQTTSDFGSRLQSSIDYSQSCFKQNHHRCSMLNDNGLCDLQSALGEDYLCDTCRLYPRHTEEFLDIRERALSLSCPEAVRMLLEPHYDFAVSESLDDTSDDEDEFEDFDFILFDKLEFARDKMLEITADKSIDFQARMDLIIIMAYNLQLLFDEGEIFEMDSVVEKVLNLLDEKQKTNPNNFFSTQSIDGIKASTDNSISTHETNISLENNLSSDECNNYTYSNNFPIEKFRSLAYLRDSLEVLIDMEVTEEAWRDAVVACQNFWKDKTESSDEWQAAMHPAADLEFAFEKVLKSMLFTYFCGAVYDGQIFARAMIAVQSVRWLIMLNHLAKEDALPSTIYLYSREVEHSDINVNSLISFFEAEL